MEQYFPTELCLRIDLAMCHINILASLVSEGYDAVHVLNNYPNTLKTDHM